MKKTTFTLLLSILCCWVAAQCPTDITFSSQGKIDSFPINYPGCTQILGNMTIEESDSASITHLDSLLQLNYVNILNVYSNAGLTSLNGLNNLTSIGGRLTVGDNAALTNLNGLNNLTSVSNNLTLYSNAALTNLNGLNNLTTVGGDLSIISHASLTSLSGLDNLTTTRGFYLTTNGALTNLNGLNNLTSVSDNFFIDYNAALTSLSGLGSLISVGATLLVYNNAALTNLNDLNNLTSVGGILDLGYNDALTSLSGLVNLTSIGNGLSVYYNSTLTSLSGLDNMDFSKLLTGILIVNNPKLFLCDVQSICDYLENGGFINISGNAPGCKSMTEIEAACGASPVEDQFTEKEDIWVFPNPATNVIYLNIPEAYKIDYELFDMSGVLVRQGSQTGGSINIRSLTPGGYILKIFEKDGLIVKKIIKI